RKGDLRMRNPDDAEGYFTCVASPLPTSDVTGRLNFSTNPEQASSARTL
ncbi:hypothetical protein AVEN_206149-1, partial [Araneus ventricosus]